MRKVGIIALIAVGAVQANATVLTFEDLPSGVNAMPANYAGFASWGTWFHYDFSQDPYNASSGVTRLFVTSEAGSHILIGSDVNFQGAFFAGHGEHDGFGNVFFKLYDNGNLVHTSGVLDPTNVPAFLASGYAGPVDEVAVGLTQGGYGFFIMDDFTYDAVPEPATMAALGAGTLCLLRRRRKA